MVCLFNVDITMFIIRSLANNRIFSIDKPFLCPRYFSIKLRRRKLLIQNKNFSLGYMYGWYQKFRNTFNHFQKSSEKNFIGNRDSTSWCARRRNFLPSAFTNGTVITVKPTWAKYPWSCSAASHAIRIVRWKRRFGGTCGKQTIIFWLPKCRDTIWWNSGLAWNRLYYFWGCRCSE